MGVIAPVELVHLLAMQLNLPVGVLVEADFWSLYTSEGRMLTQPPDSLRGRAAPQLLVALTTYARPEHCAHVLRALRAGLDALAMPLTVVVLVLEDLGDADYQQTRALAAQLFGADVVWLSARQRLGKPGFWKAYQTIFLAARALQPRQALFLQDDLELLPGFLAQARALWQATAHDARRRVLYLFSSADDEAWGRWTVYRRRAVSAQLRKTQWFDLQAFMVDRAFFELLSYRMLPVHPNRWRRRPSVSSGVGLQLTSRLRFRANIYQAFPPLAHHGLATSEMNAAARRRRPLDNRR